MTYALTIFARTYCGRRSLSCIINTSSSLQPDKVLNLKTVAPNVAYCGVARRSIADALWEAEAFTVAVPGVLLDACNGARQA